MSKGENVAYVRVSSIDQNEERQLVAIKKEISIDRWFIEKVSGKDTNREKLQEMFSYVRSGDKVYIKDFSRLARSTKDLLDIIEMLKKKEVQLISLEERLDTSSATGKLLVSLIASINEFERTNLLERQKEGIALAKAKGKYKGRKKIPKPENWEEIHGRWKNRELTAKKAMELTGLTKNVFYQYAREDNEN